MCIVMAEVYKCDINPVVGSGTGDLVSLDPRIPSEIPCDLVSV